MRPTSTTTDVSGPRTGEIRSPWREWLLSIVTLGVYAAVRHHRVNRELRDFGVDVDPVKALLAFFPGAILGIPYLVTVHRTSARIRIAQETAGLTPTIEPVVSTLLSIVCFAHVPQEQATLDDVWRADAATTRPPASPTPHPTTSSAARSPFSPDPTRPTPAAGVTHQEELR
jgi:hypothetical protein